MPSVGRTAKLSSGLVYAQYPALVASAGVFSSGGGNEMVGCTARADRAEQSIRISAFGNERITQSSRAVQASSLFERIRIIAGPGASEAPSRIQASRADAGYPT